MSHNPRLTTQTITYSYVPQGHFLTSSQHDDGFIGAMAIAPYMLTRDAHNGYTTQLTDGTLTQTRSYNTFGEIAEVSDNTFTYILTQRDNTGAITQKQESMNGETETFDYTYDNMGRLTKACRVALPAGNTLGVLAHQGCETYT